MKKVYLVCLWAGLLLSACSKDVSPVITQSFDLDDFQELALSVDGNVNILAGEQQEVQITGPEETVNNLNKTVSSGRWDISLPNSYRKKYSTLEIVITSSALEKLILSGAGNISAADTLPLSSVILAGAGNINVISATTSLSSKLSGAGNFTFAGKADTLDFLVSGSGNLYAFDLATSNTSVNIAGEGRVEVDVSSILDVNISGVGNVYYTGYPTVSLNVSGVGQVVNAN